MNYNKLKNILSEKNISIPQLAEKINSLQVNSLPEKKAITRGGLYSTIKNETLTIEMLEYISTALGVPVTTFFETENSVLDNTSLKSELEGLRKEIDSISEMNSLYKKLILSHSENFHNIIGELYILIHEVRRLQEYIREKNSHPDFLDNVENWLVTLRKKSFEIVNILKRIQNEEQIHDEDSLKKAMGKKTQKA